LCGGGSIYHHTLSGSRVEDEERLDDRLTPVIATLMAQDLVKIDRTSRDRLRVRAGAGRSGDRRWASLERLKREDASLWPTTCRISERH
jgi:hypothetical protein